LPSADFAQNAASPPQATCFPSVETPQIPALRPHATALPSVEFWQNAALAPQATEFPSAELWQKAAPASPPFVGLDWGTVTTHPVQNEMTISVAKVNLIDAGLLLFFPQDIKNSIFCDLKMHTFPRFFGPFPHKNSYYRSP
jgi:hypothetical protein